MSNLSSCGLQKPWGPKPRQRRMPQAGAVFLASKNWLRQWHLVAQVAPCFAQHHGLRQDQVIQLLLDQVIQLLLDQVIQLLLSRPRSHPDGGSTATQSLSRGGKQWRMCGGTRATD